VSDESDSAASDPPIPFRKFDAWPCFSVVHFDLAFTLESSMLSHKFRIGQRVEFDPARSRNAPGGSYEIKKRLPESRGEFEYRIKRVDEPHERLVRESELRGV
jgi:hypothetical protein